VDLIGYVAAVVVLAFGIFVVRRLILSWRRTFRTGPDHGAADPSGTERDPDAGTPSV
jgi:hypothetical protein